MYIGIFNVQLNPNTTQDVNLKQLYEYLKANWTNMGKFKMNKIEVCASSSGCTPKVKGSSKGNYLVASKTINTNINTILAKNNSKYILMFVSTIFKFKNNDVKVTWRVSRGGKVVLLSGKTGIDRT